MRAVVQRVSRAAVRVEGRVTGEIGAGAVILLGVGRADTLRSAVELARRVANLRIFGGGARDSENHRSEKPNFSFLEVGCAALVISQFTLYGDTRKGRRPSYVDAAPADLARNLYEEFVAALRALRVPTQTGVFQAHMEVEIVGDGPVTLLLDTEKTF
jgi:D-aminoacyl-tRNA deacylase